jgi:hypothetical protein
MATTEPPDWLLDFQAKIFRRTFSHEIKFSLFPPKIFLMAKASIKPLSINCPSTSLARRIEQRRYQDSASKIIYPP